MAIQQSPEKMLPLSEIYKVIHWERENLNNSTESCPFLVCFVLFLVYNGSISVLSNEYTEMAKFVTT